ncbi:hypothetical protein CR513_62883, partial [Mucuna pruriens]
MSSVSLSTSIWSVLMAETSGTKSMRRSLSSSCSLSEMPRTGPFWIRFMRCVENPAILFRSLFDGISATSSRTFLFVWKSSVMRE